MLAKLRALFIIDPLIIICTIAYGSVNLVVSLFETTGRLQVAIARAWARMLLRVSFVGMKVEGLEKIDPNGSYVFVANHLSYMDTPCILAAIPVQFRFMAKKGLFSIPFLGYHLSRAGHIAVPRDNPREAIKAMVEAGKMIRERGISVLIFPEGGRAPDAKLQAFREGAFYIAINSGVPVVPVALAGTEKVLPFGSGTVSPGRVVMRIGDPIPTEGMTTKDRGALALQMHEAVYELLKDTDLVDAKEAVAAGV
ncbi:lysophospholipid acyltransferase family protein [Bryobacter aggregatus]|uniref:lysophospholipid acyltransferase family protein n=1 Tax=Bryobacter aggregatus TaxID=360054 RepID=UPI000691AB94|nr:lysophospholipid acyltransferase family protein [Bryobacter aggregatus]